MKINFIKRINYELYEMIETFFSIFPGIIGVILRRCFYRGYLKKCGKKFWTGLHVRIQTPGNISIGNNVGVNYGTWIAANNHKDGVINIGNNVLIGPYSIIHSGNHRFNNLLIPIYKQGFEFKPVNIEDDVWIAAHCIILSGVTIGKGSIVGAGSVVTKDVNPYEIVAGVPAKKIGERK